MKDGAGSADQCDPKGCGIAHPFESGKHKLEAGVDRKNGLKL